MPKPEQRDEKLSFHNPYHFVPVEKSNHEDWFAVKEFDNRKLTYYGHDRYYPDTCSGRIVCRLTTESPIVIGGKREKPANDNEPATVKPFELTPGQPAIPASSLRGLLSSIAEAASNSALRVLDDKEMSYSKYNPKTRKTEKVAIAATVHDFFEQIDEELLPFDKYRGWISPAELLFGFVQKDKPGEVSGDAGRALAGRVQVSFGQLAQPHTPPYYEGRKVLLKSLLSPKLPCPTMYFKNRDGSDKYIKKSDLNLGEHCPQGRKMYLHHPPENGETPWVSKDIKESSQLNKRDVKKKNQRKKGEDEENLQIKAYATPIRKGLQFYFHLDFNNLDEWELGLLFYALRPDKEFRHKLGMGKAIGLGRVCIDPVGVFPIDRDQRYRVDDIFQSPRYHQVWVAGDAEKEKWPESYEREKPAEGTAPELHWETLREKFRVTMTGVIRKALELLGDPAKVTAVVHTPQIFTSRDEGNLLPKVDDPEMEQESFKWFVANEKESHPQMLTPLDKSDKLPTLKRIKGK